MSSIRGVLLAGKFRSQHDLNGMSNEDQRNTLIVELTGRTNQPVGHFQAMNDDVLAGTGALLVFLRGAGIRNDQALKSISDDDQRNIMIVEMAAQTKLAGPALQGMSNMDLVLLGLGKGASFIRGVLLAGKFRSHRDLNAMSHEDQRNTLIVELTGRTNQPVGHFQAMNDDVLAGTGALLVFLREAGIRNDQALKSISDDDQRNIMIVEMAAQTRLSGPVLQGMSNMDLVLEGLGLNRVKEIKPGPKLTARSNNFQIRPELEIAGTNFTPNGGFHLTISNVPRKTGDIFRAHSFDNAGAFTIIESFDIAQVSADVSLPNIIVAIRDDVSGFFATTEVSPDPFVVRF